LENVGSQMLPIQLVGLTCSEIFINVYAQHTHTHTLWLQIPPIKKETIISIKIATSCYISREKLGHSFWLCIFNPKTAVMLTLGWSLEKPKKLRKDELLFRLFFLSSSVAISYFFWSANHRESNLKLNTDPTFSRQILASTQEKRRNGCFYRLICNWFCHSRHTSAVYTNCKEI
jgi:hypothetical protein